jgi:hypothetical protein
VVQSITGQRRGVGQASKGRQNKLAQQIGEHLVCAQLGRQALLATPFAGNVPVFDVIAANEACETERWFRFSVQSEAVG